MASSFILPTLGLAMSDKFDLDPAERVFATEHRDYDRSYAVTQLVRWLNRTLVDTDVSARIAEFVGRYQPIADAVMPFYLELQNQSRNARYPAPTSSGPGQRLRSEPRTRTTG